MAGSRVELRKPLLVTKRRKVEDGGEYDIVGIIDSKYHFKTRPTPISKSKNGIRGFKQ